MNSLHVYIPQDRLRALARGETLREYTAGTALFADISGFTPLFELLTGRLGSQRAAEEMTRLVGQVYESLIAQVEQHRGSIIDFVGDAITCWFEDKDGKEPLLASQRAASCALAMQQSMATFARVEAIPGVQAGVAVKIGIASGTVRRFIIGDPANRLMDVLAGETLRQMSQAEGLAKKGEIVLSSTAIAVLGGNAQISETRFYPENEMEFGVLAGLSSRAPTDPWSELDATGLDESQIRPWILPSIYERLNSGLGEVRPELRPVTALFLRFDGIDYDNDPDAGKKLDVFIRWVQGTATRYDGHLLQLTLGDKGSFLYIVFGALTAHEDDAIRAVRAAESLLTLPEALRFIVPQIGLAGGPARVGPYGSSTRRTFGAIGNDVVLAARLMTAAPPGEMRCSYSVYRQTSGRLALESLPSVRVKGRADLIRVYRPVSNGQVSVTSNPSEMIGRNTEKTVLERLLDEVQGGATRLLMIEGEAGIGKSRLVDALADLMHKQGLSGLLGSGQSIEQNTPYRAWREIFNSYFDIENLSDPHDRRARVETVVLQLAPEHAQRLPVLNTVLGLDFPENDLTRSLDANLRRENVTMLSIALLRAWTDQHPLALIIEDAHWLDELSWQMAAQVVRSLSLVSAPLLFVLVNRPLEAEHPAQKILAELSAIPFAKTLTLAALEPDEIAALIADRLNVGLEALPVPLIDLVQSRANGIPFFAEELIFNLRDMGFLQTSGGAISVGDLEAAARTLPDTLHGLILARMDRQPPERQFVLKVAAVLGRAFVYAPLYYTLNRFAETPEATLKEHLNILQNADFTFLESLEPDLTYLFKHIITQEAAYQTLLFEQRRALHRLVADWYENSAAWSMVDGQKVSAQPTFHYPLLAYHYRYAEDADRERYYLGLAGEAAEKAYANDAAIGFYTRLLVLAYQQEQAEIYLKRGKIFELVGGWNAAEQDYRAALLAAENERQPMTVARSQQALGHLNSIRGDYDVALTWLEQARAAWQELAEKSALAQTLILMSRVYTFLGNYAEAEQHARQGLDLAQAVNDQPVYAYALNRLGVIVWRQGVYAESRTLQQASLAIYQTLDDKRGMALALNDLAIASWEDDDQAAAQAAFAESLKLARAIGDSAAEARALGNLGYIASLQGDFDPARELIAEVLTLRRKLGDKAGIVESLINLGSVLTGQPEPDYPQAIIIYTESFALSREIGNKFSMMLSSYNLGNTALSMQDQARARAWFAQSLAQAHAADERRLILYNLLGFARLLANLGLFARAAQLFAAAEVLLVGNGVTMTPGVRADRDEAISDTRIALGKVAFDAVWMQGAQLMLDQAIDEALKATENI